VGGAKKGATASNNALQETAQKLSGQLRPQTQTQTLFNKSGDPLVSALDVIVKKSSNDAAVVSASLVRAMSISKDGGSIPPSQVHQDRSNNQSPKRDAKDWLSSQETRSRTHSYGLRDPAPVQIYSGNQAPGLIAPAALRVGQSAAPNNPPAITYDAQSVPGLAASMVAAARKKQVLTASLPSGEGAIDGGTKPHRTTTGSGERPKSGRVAIPPQIPPHPVHTSAAGIQQQQQQQQQQDLLKIPLNSQDSGDGAQSEMFQAWNSHPNFALPQPEKPPPLPIPVASPQRAATSIPGPRSSTGSGGGDSGGNFNSAGETGAATSNTSQQQRPFTVASSTVATGLGGGGGGGGAELAEIDARLEKLQEFLRANR